VGSEDSNKQQSNDTKDRGGSIEYRNGLSLTKSSGQETMMKMPLVCRRNRYSASDSLDDDHDGVNDRQPKN
jgi:hypothetical protein